MSDPGQPPGAKPLNTWNVAALGIGSMVGAGVFALLGQVALLVRGETWIAFALGGVVALFSGYSYARLGARYPSRGGIIDYFRLGLSSPLIERSLAMLYLITLALTIAMVAKAFGAYGARLFHAPSLAAQRIDLYASGIVIALTLLNVIGSGAVGKAELLLVAIKLAILGLLIGVGITTLKPTLLEVHRVAHPSDLLASVGLAFFAYAGYGMMANAAADVRDPARSMPRAFMLAIGVVIVLYIVLALVVLGNVSPENLARYADTAVAEAAAPVLGHTGFILVSIAALLATASAINATLFSMINVALNMGQSGALPAIFGHRLLGQGTGGLSILVAIVLVLINFLPLDSIASVASATFLTSYLAVYVAAWRLRREIAANGFLLATGFLLMAVVLAAFLRNMVSAGQSIELAILLAALTASGLLARAGRQRVAAIAAATSPPVAKP
ncbi:MAG: APC family permease [Burkholderiaceae bacterium]